MNLAVLYSGGKDSNLALLKAIEYGHEVSVLLNMVSENPHSFMFHTPASDLIPAQAECLGVPLIQDTTAGEKEREVGDLKDLIRQGMREFGIDGVVTGAVRSVYQAERVQKTCKDLGIWAFNPLWMHDEAEVAREAAASMDVVISGVAAYPLTEEHLGRRFDEKFIAEVSSYGISPSGEGGEFETLVLDSPAFSKRIVLKSFRKQWKDWNGRIHGIEYEIVRKGVE